MLGNSSLDDGIQPFYEPIFNYNGDQAYSISTFILTPFALIAVNKSNPNDEALGDGIYWWGSTSYNNPAAVAEPLFVFLNASSSITHVSSAKFEVLIIAHDTPYLFGLEGAPLSNPVGLSSWIQRQLFKNRSIAQVQGFEDFGHVFLLDDGAVFVWTSSNGFSSTIVTGAIWPLPLTRYPYPSHLGLAVPSTHKITRIVASQLSTTIFFLAQQHVILEGRVTVDLKDEVSLLPNHHVPVSFGHLSSTSGTRVTSNSDFPNALQDPDVVQLYHLPAEFRNFSKVVYGLHHAMGLTSLGDVVVWGNRHASHLSPFARYRESGPNINLPIPLHAQTLFGSPIEDIVTTEDSTLILLPNKTAFYWGILTDMKKREVERTDLEFFDFSRGERDESHDYHLEGIRDYLNIFSLPIDRNVTSIHGSADSLAVVFDNSSVALIGRTWDSEGVNRRFLHLTTLNTRIGRVHKMETGDYRAVIISDNTASTGSWTLITVSSFEAPAIACNDSWSSTFGTDITTYCSWTESELGFPISQVRQVVLDTLSPESMKLLLLMNDGTIRYIVTSEIYPIISASFSHPGLPPASNIKKIALFGSQELQVLTYDGQLWIESARTSDGPLPLVGGKSPLRLLSSKIYVHDISGQTTTSFYNSVTAPTHVVLASLRPVLAIPSPIRLDDFDTIVIGDDFTCTFGDGLCRTTFDGFLPNSDAMPHRLAINHPANSKTSKISLDSFAVLSDGATSNGITRRISWGGYPTPPGMTAQYLLPHYVHDPQDFNTVLAASQDVHIVRVVPVSNYEVIAFSNCSMEIRQYSRAGPATTSGASPAQPLSDPDTAYRYPVGRFSYATHVYPSNFLKLDQCALANEVYGHRVVDVKCSSAMESFSLGSYFKGINFHCLLSTTNSSLFSFGFYDFAPMDCEGLFGTPAECWDEARANYNLHGFVFNGLHRVDASSPASAIRGRQVPQFELGSRHVVALTSDGRIVAWGDNSWSQLGWAPGDSWAPGEPADVFGYDKRDVSEGQLTMEVHEKGTPSFVVFPGDLAHAPFVKVVASSYASFAITSAHEVFSWGSNSYGVLGTGSNTMTNSSVPLRVQLPPNMVITDMACNRYTCYVLNSDGVIFSWGSAYAGLLGRAVVDKWGSEPLPAIATFLAGDSTWKSTQLITGPTAVSLLVRRSRMFAESCMGQAPSPEFVCFNGVWTLLGDLMVGPGNGETPIITITQPVQIEGDLHVSPGGTIEVHPSTSTFSSTRPLVNVSGCLKLNGDFNVVLDPSSWDQLKANLNGKTLLLAESSCSVLGGSRSQKVSSPKDCRKVKATMSETQNENGRFVLQSTFTVDSSPCNRWWIILASVLGTAIALAALGALGWTYFKHKSHAKAFAKIQTPRTAGKSDAAPPS
jgi:hypothetical protein